MHIFAIAHLQMAALRLGAFAARHELRVSDAAPSVRTAQMFTPFSSVFDSFVLL